MDTAPIDLISEAENAIILETDENKYETQFLEIDKFIRSKKYIYNLNTHYKTYLVI